jgi:hypothetical protein
MKLVSLLLLLCVILTACATPAPVEYPLIETTAEYTNTTEEFALPGLSDLPQHGQANDLYTTTQTQDALAATQPHTTTQVNTTTTQATTRTTIALPVITTRTTTTTTLPTRPTGIATPGGGGSGTTHTRVTISVTRAGLIAMNQSVTQTSHMVDSIGRESTRVYTGVPLRNVLTANGVNVNNVPANSTVVVTAHDGTTLTLTRAQFADATTLLAWIEDRGGGDVRQLDRPRLVFPQGLSGRFIQQVVSIQFNP